MRRILAVITALVSAFFAFYTVRLLLVTGFLQNLRPDGRGAYLGAVVFPIIALVFAWATVRLWRRDAGFRPPVA